MSARWCHIDYTAICCSCDWVDQGKSAGIVDSARQHNRETGHSVHVERLSVLIYPATNPTKTETTKNGGNDA